LSGWRGGGGACGAAAARAVSTSNPRPFRLLARMNVVTGQAKQIAARSLMGIVIVVGKPDS
jgi:hypothetical protein